jgi:hypothetical protein
MFIAMPVINPYQIDQGLLKICAENSPTVRLLDERGTSYLSDSDFVDPIHLGKTGSQKFMRKIVPAIELSMNGFSSLNEGVINAF